MPELSNGGTGPRQATSSAATRPSASSSGTRSAGPGLAPVVTFGAELVGGVDSSKVGKLMRRHRKTGSAILQQAKPAGEDADA